MYCMDQVSIDKCFAAKDQRLVVHFKNLSCHVDARPSFDRRQNFDAIGKQKYRTTSKVIAGDRKPRHELSDRFRNHAWRNVASLRPGAVTQRVIFGEKLRALD